MDLRDAPAATTLKLSDAQHLAEGKRLLADGYSLNKDPKKAVRGEVSAARILKQRLISRSKGSKCRSPQYFSQGLQSG